MKTQFLLILATALSHVAFATPNFDKAEKEIKFLKPKDVFDLPTNAKKVLEARNCAIPIAPGSQGQSGWTKGSYAAKGQIDWAILCYSDFGKSQIVVIWGGKNKPCPDSFGLSDNKTYLQVQNDNTIIFSRMLGTLSPRKVTSYLKKSNAPAPSTFGQDGISDSFAGKGSTVYFCTSGHWQQIVGAD